MSFLQGSHRGVGIKLTSRPVSSESAPHRVPRVPRRRKSQESNLGALDQGAVVDGKFCGRAMRRGEQAIPWAGAVPQDTGSPPPSPDDCHDGNFIESQQKRVGEVILEVECPKHRGRWPASVPPGRGDQPHRRSRGERGQEKCHHERSAIHRHVRLSYRGSTIIDADVGRQGHAIHTGRDRAGFLGESVGLVHERFA